MFKRGLIIIAFLLCAALVSAEELDNYRTVDMAVEQSASVVALPEYGDVIRIDYVEANLSLFPKASDRQVITRQDVIPSPDAAVAKSRDNLFVKWQDPREDTLRLSVSSKITSVNNLVRITQKIPFPHPGLYRQGPFDRDIDAYTKASQFVELSKAVREKSAEILEGETDYYNAVFKAAEWVRGSINYSLDTLTEEAVQNSTWVLENRYGVCDEITVLFMALLRAANIPARFVAGQVYSDGAFGNHGWAEVYFPGFGWVPFDVTFGQFGWIDPGHAALNFEHDPSEPSVSYSWRTENTKIKINPLNVKTTLGKKSGEPEKHAELSVEPLRSRAANGSYVPVKVTAKNLAGFYVPLTVTIAKAPGLLEENQKPVLLRPFEERALFWTIILPENVSKGYVYTTLIEARAAFAGSAGANITFSEDDEYYSREWALGTVQRLAPKEEKEYIPDISLSCSSQNEYYYRHEPADIKCTVENRGTTSFRPLRVCLETDCRDTDLLIGEKKHVEFSMPLEHVNASDFAASAESRNMVKYAYPSLRIIETPKIEILDFEPKRIKYNEESSLTLLVLIENEAFNVTMNIMGLGYSSFGKLSRTREMAARFNSKDFRRGELIVDFEYYDAAGKMYADEYSFAMDVYGIPWHVRLAMWLEELLPFVSF